MAVIIMRLRLHAGQNWMPIGVDLEHRALDCPDEVERILGPNVRFDQPCNSVCIRESVLNRTSPEADKRLFGVLKDLADRLLAERKASADIVQRVTTALVDSASGWRGLTRRRLANSFDIAQITAGAACCRRNQLRNAAARDTSASCRNISARHGSASHRDCLPARLFGVECLHARGNALVWRTSAPASHRAAKRLSDYSRDRPFAASSSR